MSNAGDEMNKGARDAAEKVQDAAHVVGLKARDTARNLAEKAEDSADDLAGKAKDSWPASARRSRTQAADRSWFVELTSACLHRGPCSYPTTWPVCVGLRAIAFSSGVAVGRPGLGRVRTSRNDRSQKNLLASFCSRGTM